MSGDGCFLSFIRMNLEGKSVFKPVRLAQRVSKDAVGRWAVAAAVVVFVAGHEREGEP